MSIWAAQRVEIVDGSGRVVAIVSERYIIRGISENAGALLALPVAYLMTHEAQTCVPEDRLIDLMQVLRTRVSDTVQSEVEGLHGYIRSA